MVRLALFGVCALVTFVAVWPAIWLAPVEMIGRMIAFLRETGGEPDEVGSFFFGQALGDPGPLYYPVALAFRLSPGLLVGLLGLVIGWRRVQEKGALCLVLLFITGFALMMILSPKKFDRYLLPIEPMLAVMAAVGAVSAARSLIWTHSRVVAMAIVIGLQFISVVSVYPYYLAYYNPLLGGGPRLQRR